MKTLQANFATKKDFILCMTFAAVAVGLCLVIGATMIQGYFLQ